MNLLELPRNFWDFINGRKTYIVGCAMIAWAFIGLWGGAHDQEAARLMILNGLGIMGIRHGISKLQ